MKHKREEHIDLLKVDPFSDLFFGIAVVFLFLVVVLIPHLTSSVPPPVTGEGKKLEHILPKAVSYTIGQKSVSPLFATFQGVFYGAEGKQFVDLKSLMENQVFELFLKDLTQKNQPIALLIAPGGEESAFLLEGMFYRLGIERYFSVRMDQSCSFIKTSEVKRFCFEHFGGKQTP